MIKIDTVNELDTLLLDNSKMVFIDFYAEWCGPCKMVEPVMDQLSVEYKDQIDFCKVNIDDVPEATAKYGVRAVPTFLILKNEEIVYRHAGAAPKSFFDAKISSLLK